MKSWWRLRILCVLPVSLIFNLQLLHGFWAVEAASKGKSLVTPPPQYYYRGGFRLRHCNPTSQVQVQSFSQSPKITVRYDGRHFNSSFATLRRASVRENMLHISCNAKYPVTLLPNPLIMVDKSLLKAFEDNMDIQCNSEPRPKSPCTNYTVTTTIPVHLLYLSIDTQCQSFCKQVAQVSQLKVMDNKGDINGNITYSRRSLPSGDQSKNKSISSPPSYPSPQDHHELEEDENDSNNLVQIYVSPVGTSGKSWIIKCSTDSDLTARGATMLMKLDSDSDPFLVKEAKEYRKAGIHTIRATFKLPTEDVDYVHCLFPRLDDFLWISRHTSIHFHDPISYWECILRLCGAFLCSFFVIGGICIVINKWLHSDCCAKKTHLSSSTSQSQLSLRYNSQRSIGGGYGWEENERGKVTTRDADQWGGTGSGTYNSQISLVDGRMIVETISPMEEAEEDDQVIPEGDEEEEEDQMEMENEMDDLHYHEVIIAQSYGTMSCHL